MRLETKVDDEKTTYDESLQQLQTAKTALDAVKTKAKEELGDQPDMVDNMDEAMKWMNDFREKTKKAQDYYNGKGRGANQSCIAYSEQNKLKLAEAINKLETKYETAKTLEEFEEHKYKDLEALRKDCNITSSSE